MRKPHAPGVLRIGIIVAMALGATARAEVLVTEGGDRIVGRPLGVKDGKLRFASDRFGVIEVPEGLAKVEPSKPVAAVPPAVRAPVYREQWGSDGMSGGSAFGVAKPVPKSEPVSPADHWKHRVSAGYIWQAGLVESDTVLCGYEGLWRGHVDELRFVADYMRSVQTYSDGAEYKVGDRLRLESRFRHDFGSAYFSESLARWRRDYALGIKRRATVAQGAGYRYLNTENTHAAVIAGAAMRLDLFEHAPRNDSTWHPYAYLSEELSWKVNERFTLRHDCTLFEKLGMPEKFGVECGTEGEAACTEHLALSVRYAIDYDVDRYVGLIRRQQLFSTALVFRF